MTEKLNRPQIIDYEGSQYRTDFWEGQGREYEDFAERNAIKRLLPDSGGILMEAGAGFGRLAQLYDGYQKILLVDYSLSLLQEARQLWGDDERFVFVAASVYDLPFVDGLIDSLVMIRVMHHLQQPDKALLELSRVLTGDGIFILEYANKRNFKAIARYWLGRQSWDPFDRQPYEFVHLNYDFHPVWMSDLLRKSGFSIEQELALSSFRIKAVKRMIPASILARIDTMLASPAATFKLSPSVLVRCEKDGPPNNADGFFRCPDCGSIDLQDSRDALVCQGCGTKWRKIDGIYDFRFPKE